MALLLLINTSIIRKYSTQVVYTAGYTVVQHLDTVYLSAKKCSDMLALVENNMHTSV